MMQMAVAAAARRRIADPLAGISGNTLTFESWRNGAALNGSSSAPVDDESVVTIIDLGPAANSWTQATSGQRAIWKTAQLNGFPALRFDGVDDRYAPMTPYSTTKTVVAVLKVISDSSLGGLIGTGIDKGIRRNDPSTWRDTTTDANAGDFTADGVMYINGAVSATQAVGEYAIMIATSPSALLTEFIGGYFPPRYLHMDLVALRTYSRELDSGERELINSTYSAKTGIALSP